MEPDESYRIYWSYPEGERMYLDCVLDSHHPEDGDMIVEVPVVVDYDYVEAIEEIEEIHGSPQLSEVSVEPVELEKDEMEDLKEEFRRLREE